MNRSVDLQEYIRRFNADEAIYRIYEYKRDMRRRFGSTFPLAEEKQEVVANCDHLARLRFAKALPWAFTEHGAIMAATVLNGVIPAKAGNQFCLTALDGRCASLARNSLRSFSRLHGNDSKRRIGFTTGDE